MTEKIDAINTESRDQRDNQGKSDGIWRTSAFAQLSQGLLQASTLDDVLHACLPVITPTGIDGVTFLLTGGSPDERYLEIATAWERDEQPALPVGTRFSERDFQYMPLLQVEQSLTIDDLANDPRVGDALKAALLKANVRALVALPLRSAHEIFGLIIIDRSQPRPFDAESVYAYEAVAALATGAIEKLRLIRETNRALVETSALYTISRKLSSARNINEILHTVLDSELFDAAGGSIALLEEATVPDRPKELVFWAAAGVGAEKLLGMRIPVTKGVIGWVVRKDQPAIVSNAYADKRFYAQVDKKTQFRTRSILCAPLRVEGRVTGAIELVDVHPERLNQEGARLLGQVAEQAALFIENQRLLTQTRQQAQELGLLLELSQEMAGTLDREEMLNIITSRVLDLVKADGCHVFLLQSRADHSSFLMPVASSDRDAAFILNTPLEMGQGITGRVAQTGVGVVANRVDQDPRAYTVPGTEREPESLISVPLKSEGRVIGVMTVSRRGEHIFHQNDLQLVTAMANQAATVLENTRLFNEIQQRTRELSALNAVVSTASQSLTLNEMLDATLERIEEMLYGSATLISLTNPATGELEIATHRNLPDPLVKKLRKHSMKDTVYEVTQKKGQTYLIADLEEGAPVDTSDLIKFGLRTYLGTPLVARGQVLGTLSVFNTEPNSFTTSDANLLTAIGHQMGIAVRNARLYEQTEQALKESQLLYEASKALSNALTLDDVLAITLRRMAEHVSADQCRAVLFDEAKGYGRVVAELHETPGIDQVQIPMQDNPSYEVLRDTGQAIAIEDVQTHPVTANIKEMLAEHGVKSTMFVPLIVQGNLIGSIGLDATHARRRFTQAEINFCSALADRAALAIQNRQLLAQTRSALQETTTLYHASRALTQAQNLEQVLRAITDHLPIADIDQCWLALSDTETETDAPYRSVEIKALWDHEGDTNLLHTLLTDRELPIMTESGVSRVWVIDDIDQENRFDATSIATLKSLGIKSALIIPLIAADKLLGWLVLITHHRTHSFDLEQIRPYQALADQAAMVIRNQQLIEQVQASLHEIEAVHRQYLRSEWSKYLKTRQEKLAALAYERGKVQPAEELEHPLIEQAIKQGSLVTHTGKGQDGTLAPAGASLVAPLKVRGQVLGVLGVEDPDQPHEWTDEEISMLEEIAERVAQAVESARLLDTTQASLAEQERLAVQLEAASKVSRAATSILELDVLLPSVVELIRDHFNFYHASIFLVDSTRSWAVLEASTGEVGQKLLQRGHALQVGGSSIIGYVTSTGEPKIAQDVEQDDLHLRNELLPDTRSEMAIPLRTGDRIIGALDVQSTEPNAFGPEDVQVLTTLADQLATAIDNARLYQEQLETAEKLREVDRLKSQFLANMSHELRTPLNSIIGFSRVILKGIDGPLTDLQKQDLTAIYNSGQNLLKLINDILDHAKIEAGKMELTFEDTDLTEVITGALTTAKALVKDKPEVELRADIAPDLPHIIADGTRLRQVLLNLLSNASKFTNEGYIELSATHDERYVTIKVRDTGVGIPPDKFEVIFQAFEQVDGSPTRAVGGTGLGLPISRQFVEMHGGRIWVESEVNVGSTFTVKLPIKGPQAIEDEDEELPVSDEQRLVLAVDDDIDVIQMYKRHLEKQNYHVYGLRDSEQAVEKARALRPYAILLDLLMPNKDGWTVIRELKSDPETHDIPIIMCSIVSAAGRGFSLGAADFLVKPISEDQLLTALARLQDSHKPDAQVLIIDDTLDDRKLLRRILESTDGKYRVLEAANGIEGIDIIQNTRPDLVILDLMMPEMDGFAVLETLKSDDELRQIPIVIVTAKELTDEERMRINGQAAALFQKGLFKAEELLQDVNYALHQIGKPAQEISEE